MLQFLEYSFSGLATSAVYAVAATGLVLTYTTTGIFNFAQGAIGMVAAFVYWQLRFGWHWPAPVALVVCLAVVGPLFGVLLDLVIMRRLEGAPEITRLVVTISLLVALLGAGPVDLGPQRGAGREPDVPGQRGAPGRGAAVAAGSHRHGASRSRWPSGCACSSTPPASASPCGPRSTTAAWPASTAPGPTGARCSPGPSASRWPRSSGILIAPTLSLSALPLTLLIVNAYAAAVIGRLRSLPLHLRRRPDPRHDRRVPVRLPPLGQRRASTCQGLYLSIPVIVLFVALLVMPRARLRGHATAAGRESSRCRPGAGALVFGGRGRRRARP